MLKNIFKPSIIIYTIILLLSLIVMSRIGLILYNPDGSFSDDYINSTITSYSTIFTNIYNAYFSLPDRLYSGSRLVIYFLTSSVMMYNVWLWRILNSLFILLLIFSIVRFTNISGYIRSQKEQVVIILFSLISVALINISTLYWSIFWITGSFNYLWSPVAVLICLYPFYQLFTNSDENIFNSKKSYLYIFPLLLATSAEQGAAIIFVFSICAIAYRYFQEKRLIVPAVVFMFISVISIIFHLLSPGNEIRVLTETQNWYPKFAEMSTFEKVFEGYNWTILYHYFYKSHYLIFTLLTLLYFLQRRVSRQCKFLNFAMVFSLIYTAFYILLSTLDFSLPNSFKIYNNAVEETLLHLGSVVVMPKEFEAVPFIIQTAILLLIPYFIYKLTDLQRSLPLILLYFASLSSSLLLSFSPTVYASGVRVFFLSDILMIVIVVKFFSEFLKGLPLNDRYVKSFTAIMIIVILSDIVVTLSKYIVKLMKYLPF